MYIRPSNQSPKSPSCILHLFSTPAVTSVLLLPFHCFYIFYKHHFFAYLLVLLSSISSR
ncbi:conserved hypothetical protein [Ricinus communis]|uniref:Uncharacterized protein n=1 Tax=Ricinus communis TaxID=3988 RepID=B9SEN8_RICCO|nr:conserved hypothetical protein [Ricinus communis]